MEFATSPSRKSSTTAKELENEVTAGERFGSECTDITVVVSVITKLY